jgi:hypothetical protein
MADEQPPERGAGKAGAKSLDIYRRMLSCLFVATCVIILLSASLAALDFWRPPTRVEGATRFLRCEMLLAVACAGAFGAAFSSLLRVYQFSDLPSEITNNMSMSNRDLALYTLTPLLIGVISALVLYAIFASELLTGSMFPSLPKLYPGDPVTAVNALFWSFVAGFAERLVPGFLQSFADSASREGPKGKATPKTPPTESSRAQAHDERGQ